MKKEIKQIEIIDMDLLCRGIGKIDNKVVFIPDTVTGDIVTYETITSKKRYDIGKLCEIIKPSANRTSSECPHFKDCGGCSFLGITRDLEKNIKLRAVESAFRRAGIRINAEKILAGNSKNYRNKVVFHLDDIGKYGFFTSGSHNCNHVSECLLIPQIFNEIISYSNEYFTNNKSINAPQDIMLRLGNNNVMLVASVTKQGQCMEYLDSVTSAFPSISCVYECIGYPTSYDTQFIHHSKDHKIKTDFGGIVLEISPKSFFQVNLEIAEMLCGEISNMISPCNGETILDLYCGIGTISLYIAKKHPLAQIIGIEINESAVEDAKENCTLSGIENAGFFCCDAGKTDISNLCANTIIVDPPRYGLTDTTITSLLKTSPEKLVYMSCNPSTLAGDCSKLINGGYTITKCISADMFPGCAHVETVVLLEKYDKSFYLQ